MHSREVQPRIRICLYPAWATAALAHAPQAEKSQQRSRTVTCDLQSCIFFFAAATNLRQPRMARSLARSGSVGVGPARENAPAGRCRDGWTGAPGRGVAARKPPLASQSPISPWPEAGMVRWEIASQSSLAHGTRLLPTQPPPSPLASPPSPSSYILPPSLSPLPFSCPSDIIQHAQSPAVILSVLSLLYQRLGTFRPEF
ncbi:hypothetical protein DFH27DRAFT_313436 [Peziza echinospora]|nr:hypothetical protein DFH27DRAFT_313436 [Peziza echinospora]